MFWAEIYLRTPMISYSDIKALVPEEDILIQEPLKKHTTFLSGGECDFFVSPENEEKLKSLIERLKETDTPWFLIGRGSNILVSDKGFPGVVISLKKHFRDISFNGNEMTCGAGVMMHEAADAAAKMNLAGFEFASGIPGTIGGGLRMNAGAYGPEFKDIVTEARLLLKDGEIRTFKNEELDFRYRSSAVKDLEAVVLSVTFGLEAGNEKEIREKIAELGMRRKNRQPLEYGSAGSTFKRPPGLYAGAVIEEAGLKGYRYKNAGVSEKHANFVVNYGGATSEEIAHVIKHVQEVVREKNGIVLETEVLPIGDFEA